MTMTQTDEHVMTVHKMAADTLTAMGEQAVVVAEVWKNIDEEKARKTSVSLARQTTQLFNMFFGNASRITKDGRLSLFVSTSSGFVFGLIGHPEWVDPATDEDITMGITAPLMGRYCVTADDDHKRCGKPVRNDKPTCEGHEPFIASLPIPVEWSFHS